LLGLLVPEDEGTTTWCHISEDLNVLYEKLLRKLSFPLQVSWHGIWHSGVSKITQCFRNWMLSTSGRRVGGIYSVGSVRNNYSQSLDQRWLKKIL
jgi:hypothetical protein